MGLDIYFYAAREDVGYFRKVNFFLTYFDIEDSDNCCHRKITKEKLNQFAVDISNELSRQDAPIPNSENEQTLEPLNPKLRTKEVFFGGSTKYDYGYWEDLKDAHNWAVETLESFDWENECLVMHPWW